jgi:hypothetical protein
MLIPGSEAVASRSYDVDGGLETSDLGPWQ